MKENETWMNSFLFNISTLLICSVAITRFMVSAFNQYADFTVINCKQLESDCLFVNYLDCSSTRISYHQCAGAVLEVVQLFLHQQGLRDCSTFLVRSYFLLLNAAFFR